MKVACVYLCNFSDRKDYFMSLMPSGVPSIASVLEQNGYDVVLANLSKHGAEKGARILLRENPDVVTVSIFSFNRTESLKFIRCIKRLKPHLLIVAGGQHPTFLHDLLKKEYPEIDYIIRGEGELAILEILKSQKEKLSHIIKKDRINDLDSLPFASRFSGKMIGVDPCEQFRYIITTRGCPSSCRYCSSPSFWERRVTYRSPENIVEELKFIYDKYGIIYFSIRDDNFTLNKQRVMKFTELLNKSGLYMMWNCQARVDTIDEEMLFAMKSCGLEHIQFGVESGSEKILKLYDKSTTIEKIKKAAIATRKCGIYLSFYLMAGMDGETEEDIEQTINLLKKTLPHDTIVSPVAYYPGTSIYEASKKKGKIDDSVWLQKDDSGLYVIDKKKSAPWVKKILKESQRISLLAEYKAKDFKEIRRIEPEGIWMTDIIEGDYYLNNGNTSKAFEKYQDILKKHPKNIWAYIKSAEAIAFDDPLKSIKILKEAARINPKNHETWKKIAEIEFEIGNITNGAKALQKAHSLNPNNREVLDLLKKFKL